MRIGLVVYDGLERTSGGYLYDRRIVNGLRDRGHTVKLVTPSRDSYRQNLLDNATGGMYRRIGELAATVDVLLQDELCHPSLIGPNVRLRRQSQRPPIVTIVHHLRSSESWGRLRAAGYRFVESAYLRTVDGCIHNSKTTKGTVDRIRHGLPSTVARPGTEHITAALSPADVRERAHQPGPLRVLFVGSVVERKGIHTLIRALDGVTAPWSLTVVGDKTIAPEYTARLQALIADSGVGSQVRLTGRVSDTQLREFFTDHQVLAVPSQYEGYGIVYLEGMAFGLPAIGTRAGGAREVIDDGASGHLVPPERPARLRAVLSELATDRDHLAEMGVTAQHRFHEHPTWEDAVDRIERFLLEISPSTSGEPSS